MATRKPRRFDLGGEILPTKEVNAQEAADKAAGLQASKNEDVGFFGRLRMGNIDDPSSEAYKRFGAGRGRAERVPVEDLKPTPVRETAKVEADPLEEANKQESLDTTPGPRATDSTNSTKPVPRPSVTPSRAEKKDPAESYKKVERQRDTTPYTKVPAKPIYSNEGYGKGKESDRARYTPPPRAPKTTTQKTSPKVFMPERPDNSFPGSKFKAGGTVSSASKRADGIASKGKTRCRVC
jgi:hypothetical protein